MGKNLKQSLAGLSAVLLFFAGGIAQGQYRPDLVQNAAPIQIPNPEIVEKHNAQVPLDDSFVNHDGKSTTLGDLFNHGKPVIVSLVYFNCPSLCNFTQDALANAVRQGPRGLRLGEDYDIVVVSIDPDDTPAAAAGKREKYLGLMDRKVSQNGLTYLTGKEGNIKQLADSVGFGYQQNFNLAPGDTSGKYAHSSGIFVCTADGRLSQTILGINYDPDLLHNALTTAAGGYIGSGFFETVALHCGAVRFNPYSGKYETNPWFWAGTATGGASILFMAIFLSFMWRGEWKRKPLDDAAIAAQQAAEQAAQSADADDSATDQSPDQTPR